MPKTLLLADDSVTIQRVIELTFAHEDVRVVSVSDGRRAVQWMDAEWPDIVLVDVEVPEVDGYTVASHVKQSSRLRHVPVLLLAGAFEPIDEERVRQIGCDGVLVKPFEPQQLVTRVKALLERSGSSTNGNAPMEQRDSVRRTEPDGANITPFPAARMMTHAAEPEPLEPPSRPVWDSGAPAAAPPVEKLEPSAPPRVSLASAFTALLAAEQSSQPAAASAQAAAVISEATVEDAVRRVLVRMTDELVRRIVLETAERLIKEEIEKIKATPE
jgi:DNA-binding response OmpR family regulator